MKYNEVKIKDIGKVNTGCTPSTKKAEYYDEKRYMFVAPADIKSKKYVTNSEKHISSIAYQDYKGRFIKKGSIVIDCIGSDMGNSAIVIDECLTNQQINAICDINLEKYNSEYIYYVLSTMKTYFHKIGSNGSTMPIISNSVFENIRLPILEKSNQDKLTNILSALDNKIMGNNKTNNNLLLVA